MVLFIAQYLLAGVVASFLIELVIRKSQQRVTAGERFQMVVLWPLMVGIFLVNFFKGLFGS